MAQLFKPDSPTNWDSPKADLNYVNKLFLAGSIEMGAAEDWQQKVIDELWSKPDLAIYNPRRNKWEPDLLQTITCDTFREQVTWEQKYLDQCNIVLVNLLPNTHSPISLLELGQLSKHMKRELDEKDKHTIVVCPKEFWRRGNVEVVCMIYKMPLYETLDEGIAHIKTLIQLQLKQ